MTNIMEGPDGPLSMGPRGPIEPIFAALKTDPRLAGELVTRPHPLLAMLAREEYAVVFAPAAVWDRGRELLKPFAHRFAESTALLVLLGRAERSRPRPGAVARPRRDLAGAAVERRARHRRPSRASSSSTRRRAPRRAASGSSRYAYELERARGHRARDDDRARRRTSSSASSSRRAASSPAPTRGASTSSKGKSRQRAAPLQAHAERLASRSTRASSSMPISNRSMAGSAAIEKKTINIADVYELPPSSTFTLRPELRRAESGTAPNRCWRSRSSRSEGTSSASSSSSTRRRTPTRSSSRRPTSQEQVVPFDERSEELLGLRGGAGRRLARERAPLRRDPAPLRGVRQGERRGDRVARPDDERSLAPRRGPHGRAREGRRQASRPARTATRSSAREDLRELEYASLLHDFGKIGVREKVLVKANKLYDERLELIRARFDYVARSIEADILARKVRALERGASSDDIEAIDAELALRQKALDRAVRRDPRRERAHGHGRRGLRAHRDDRARDVQRPARRRAAPPDERRGRSRSA